MALLEEVAELHFCLIVEEVTIDTIVVQVATGTDRVQSEDDERALGELGYQLLLEDDAADEYGLVRHFRKQLSLNLMKRFWFK